MKTNSKNDFCIVTPFHKNSLNEYEKISLNSILNIFKNEDKYFVTFHDNNLQLPNFKKLLFEKYYFKSIDSYNKLCYSLEFYRKFINYKYILICHLDVIVLNKNLIDHIIKKKISYIGAPAGKKNIFDRTRKKLWGRRFFCNGGFSLRNTNDFIKVLESDQISKPINFLTIYECLKSGFIKYFELINQTNSQKKIKKAEFFTKNFYLHEDTFWTYFAKIFYDKFKLPTLNETNKFAFDGDPFFFYMKNKYKLPMALHGHYNYLNFLKKIGYQLN